MAKPRLKPYVYDELNPTQKVFWNKLLAGPRGRHLLDDQGHLQGPFDVLIRSPGVGQALSELGEQLRFTGKVPASLLELAILTTATHWKAEIEWHFHKPLAISAGFDEETLSEIAAGGDPKLKFDEQAVYDLTRELLRTGACSDETFKTAESILGEQLLVNVVVVVGYYTLLAFGMGAFSIALPEGTPPRFS